MGLLDDLLQAGKYPPRDYDGLCVSETHMQRLVAEAPPNPTQTYAGIKVIASNSVPPGFAVMTLDGVPIGVIDFKRGVAALVPVKKEHPIFGQ